MVQVKDGIVKVTIRLPEADYYALEEEAANKSTPPAAYMRDLLQAHLLNRDLDGRIEETLEKYMTSERFDDVFFSKLERFFTARKKD